MTTATALRGARRRTPRRRVGSRNNLAGYLFMTPWLLGFVFIVGGPVVISLYLSLTDDPPRAAQAWAPPSAYGSQGSPAPWHA